MLPVNGLAKEEGKGGRKRFLAALEMTAWGMAIPCIIQRMCGKRVLPVSSSRAESRGLFRWRQEGERLTARNGKHRITERWDGASRKRLSEGGEKKGTKKISRCARNNGIEQAVCHGNKKRGGIPLFLFISMATQADLSAHLRYLRSRLRRGRRALRGCRSRRRRRCRGDGCHARHLRHSRYHRS